MRGEAIGMVKKRRKFGGEIFTWKGNQQYRDKAERSAKWWRKRGYKARIVRETNPGNSQGYNAGEPIFRIYLRKKK
jgi:hypothetical protein